MHKYLEYFILMRLSWRHQEKIIAHEKPNQQATWSKHGVWGWYICPALEHYRCYKVFVTETIAERIYEVV